MNLQLAICNTQTCLSSGYSRKSIGHANVNEILKWKKGRILYAFFPVNNALKENPFGYVNSIRPKYFSRTNNRMYNIYLCHTSRKEFYLLSSFSWEEKIQI